MYNLAYRSHLKSIHMIYQVHKKSQVKYWFAGLLIFLFLPWTQNIKAKGMITTRMQEQRPQEINSPIPGKIVRWWVKEGDFVRKGDTIMQLSEIKEDYLDPQLVDRTREQIDAKKSTTDYYRNKALTAAQQIEALNRIKRLKIEQLNNKRLQLENKFTGEKAELAAAENEYNLLKDQFERQQKMYEEGLVSQTQLQQRNAAYQSALSRKVVVENKLLQTRQEIVNTEIEQHATEQDYAEKGSKVEGDRLQSLGQVTAGEGDIAKLENQLSNYIIRNGMYIILAPQDGQIIQAKKSGIGEILKDGERITMIVPDRIHYAVEMYVRPVDLPLINIGQKVRLTFDGFPSIIFSGWPENSYGTFGGKIIAYEHNINPNGLFRVLIVEDSTQRKWPQQIKTGSGAQSIVLLSDVPLWYELWRNINGFPPDYYHLEDPKTP
jgi:multidrug resistance efflux pump